MKKLIASIILLLTLCSSVSATTFISAKVNRVASVDGIVRVMLYDSNNPICQWTGNRWFSGTLNMNDHILAIAMTSIVSGATVRVGVEACFTEPDVGSTFSSFGLNRD